MNLNQEKLEEIILSDINKIIKSKKDPKDFNKKIKNNKEKVHFLPIEYRNLISYLQSLSITFGNFIEKLIRDIVKEDKKYNLSKLSGKKINGIISKAENDSIEDYMKNKRDLNLSFLDDIKYEKLDIAKKIKQKDIDLLLYDNNSNYYLFEIKLLDNHDTGKHENIYKKLFETTFALRRYFEENKINYKKIQPILYFFNDKKRWKDDYLEENKNLLRGEEFWIKFTNNILFSDIKEVFNKVSNNEIIKNNLKNEIENILTNFFN
ncbi:Type II restriction enzyme HinfI-like protein [Candidatus Hepatoplasma crinochetorum Av]|uniref:type II site-specific deoxyribonuclease n=1 Tax=Candidatus Hepatoplasma crinochetorum Av TaxID=1427984 RepID=W8GNJ3_9MOLU|nr:hypothetical protein [Candidatus Hepatoplasma crinochetorum]AHK22596.1 Type II restriction enzyme HinfI-like protein [Candidatus Hepatoplasma crinochetorum Av]